MKLLASSKCPGKLILSGEHSTVYGKVKNIIIIKSNFFFFLILFILKHSVAVTVDLFTETKIYEISNEENLVHLRLENYDFQTSWPLNVLQSFPTIVKSIDDFVFTDDLLFKTLPLRENIDTKSPDIKNSCAIFLLLYLTVGDLSERKCLQVNVVGNLPTGAGLGSSSSYIVSLAKAMFDACQIKIDKSCFNKWCFEMDKLFHGKPSGVDNSICTYGGAILFGQGKIIEQLKHDEVPALKMILVNTNVPRNTKNIVQRCRTRLDLLPNISEPILNLFSAVSEQVWTSLKTEQYKCLSILFEINQNLLNCLDVGHERIDFVINIARRYNFTSKLSGAGGGGIVMIYLYGKFLL